MDLTGRVPAPGESSAWGHVPYQRVTDIVGYTGDADQWCPPCAKLVYDRRIDGILRTIRQGDAIDHEGNTVAPLFRNDIAPDDICGRCRNDLSEE
jgi:hypothetical protein